MKNAFRQADTTEMGQDPIIKANGSTVLSGEMATGH